MQENFWMSFRHSPSVSFLNLFRNSERKKKKKKLITQGKIFECTSDRQKQLTCLYNMSYVFQLTRRMMIYHTIDRHVHVADQTNHYLLDKISKGFHRVRLFFLRGQILYRTGSCIFHSWKKESNVSAIFVKNYIQFNRTVELNSYIFVL